MRPDFSVCNCPIVEVTVDKEAGASNRGCMQNFNRRREQQSAEGLRRSGKNS